MWNKPFPTASLITSLCASQKETVHLQALCVYMASVSNSITKVFSESCACICPLLVLRKYELGEVGEPRLLDWPQQGNDLEHT